MKRSGTARPTFITLLTLLGLFLIVGSVDAQDKKTVSKVEITQDGETIIIEVEDGRTRVNGELIPEGADIKDYLPEGFESEVYIGDDGEVHMLAESEADNVFISRRGPRGSGKTVWYSDDAGEHGPMRFKFEGAPEMLEKLHERNFELAQAPEFEVFREMVPNGFFFSSSPEVSKKEREAREIASKLRNAEGSDRQKIESELDALLNEIFEAKMEIRQERLQKLRKDLEEGETTLNDRRARKTEIIERRKAELTGSDDRYRW